MPSNDTFAVAAGLPSAAGGASSTAEFQFTDTAATPVRLRLRIPAGQIEAGKPFRVLAGGRVTGGATTNFTVRLDEGDSATIASNETIEASTARAVNSEDANWFIEAVCIIDATSDKLGGYGRSMINNLFDAEAALDAEASAALPGEIAFTVTGQFSVSDAGNKAFCDFFEASSL